MFLIACITGSDSVSVKSSCEACLLGTLKVHWDLPEELSKRSPMHLLPAFPASAPLIFGLPRRFLLVAHHILVHATVQQVYRTYSTSCSKTVPFHRSTCLAHNPRLCIGNALHLETERDVLRPYGHLYTPFHSLPEALASALLVLAPRPSSPHQPLAGIGLCSRANPP